MSDDDHSELDFDPLGEATDVAKEKNLKRWDMNLIVTRSKKMLVNKPASKDCPPNARFLR